MHSDNNSRICVRSASAVLSALSSDKSLFAETSSAALLTVAWFHFHVQLVEGASTVALLTTGVGMAPTMSPAVTVEALGAAAAMTGRVRMATGTGVAHGGVGGMTSITRTRLVARRRNSGNSPLVGICFVSSL